MLQAGIPKRCSRLSGVHRYTIRSLLTRFQQFVNTLNRRPVDSRRPCVTSVCQDNLIRLVHLRNRFQKASLIARSIPGLKRRSARTERNCLLEQSIRPKNPALRPILFQCNRGA